MSLSMRRVLGSRALRPPLVRTLVSMPKLIPEAVPTGSTQIFRTVEEVKRWRRPQYTCHRVIGLVPTMGALHEGHLSLISAAVKECDHVVVSMYVNPAQFGPHEDLDSYPANWDSDLEILAALEKKLAKKISAVFAPTTKEMYPFGFPGQEVDSKGSFVIITPLSERLEGKSRPTFFRGVATVCMKLLNIVQPDKVFFGQKDIQQSLVIQRMVDDLMVPTKVIVCPTVREPDGLARSSRNVYLGTRRRKVAKVLHDALASAKQQYLNGRADRSSILGSANGLLESTQATQVSLPAEERVRFEVDYVSFADRFTMDEVEEVDPSRGAIVSAAIKMLPVELATPGEDVGYNGGPAVRLIDNMILEPSG
ncbi:pantoate-beta-alanine ligase [Durotheca rogersii]|uniref:pantoate-beta-alanine ligase n=1 Tax=Durotheca rogersii TaxID=419775 RepID=UPI0022207563|nr:pantoate-beta-alanine ligase [Durotheca rogersii]KAI5861597.1 pantoate-beta-alanine ligase [Durotheca rogersii]